MRALHSLEGAAFASFAPRLRRQADLSRTNWFRVGGQAEYLFKPESTQDLADFLRLLPHSMPVMVLGVGSNVIVRDGGIDGVVIRLGRGFTDILTPPSPCKGEGRDGGRLQHFNQPKKTPTQPSPLQGEGLEGSYITAGAGALDIHVAATARDAGLGGLEFLSGIPGTIGGGVRMNAGAYGSDMAHVLEEAEIVTRAGEIRRLPHEALGFTYRHSALPADVIVTRAWLRVTSGDKAAIQARMDEIARAREATQPIRTRTGGSTFKNPPGHKAWELIDRAGCRGLTWGGAQVSELHCNFLINTGTATAADLEALGEEVRKRVQEATGVLLEWEIKRIGKPK